MKKKLCLLLSALLLLAALSACGDAGVRDYTDDSPTPGASATPEPDAAAGMDYAAAYAAYAPDTVVMTVDGSEVHWEELFYWLYNNISMEEAYYGAVADFNAASVFDASQTANSFYMQAATESVTLYHAVLAQVGALGIELTEADEQTLADNLASNIASTLGEEGTEEAYFEQLETIYVSRELYELMTRVPLLYERAFLTLYGERGEILTDEEVMAFAEENGYMTAKHILILTQDAEGAALDDEAKAEKLTQAEDILAQLQAATDLEATFDELMNAHSEDTGLPYYPDGYCFAPGQMEAAFESAAAALGDYELSGIVETGYGYHILLRLPTRPTDVVTVVSESETQDLRYTAANAAFNERMNGWLENAEVVWAPGFEELDLNGLFGIVPAEATPAPSDAVG